MTPLKRIVYYDVGKRMWALMVCVAPEHREWQKPWVRIPRLIIPIANAVRETV